MQVYLVSEIALIHQTCFKIKYVRNLFNEKDNLYFLKVDYVRNESTMSETNVIFGIPQLLVVMF